ncbi:hypothetical protein ACM9XD_15205 [Xanthomonas sacchari]
MLSINKYYSFLLSSQAFQYSNNVTTKKNKTKQIRIFANHKTSITQATDAVAAIKKASLMPLRTRTSDCFILTSIFIHLSSEPQSLLIAMAAGVPSIPKTELFSPYSVATITGGSRQGVNERLNSSIYILASQELMPPKNPWRLKMPLL